MSHLNLLWQAAAAPATEEALLLEYAPRTPTATPERTPEGSATGHTPQPPADGRALGSELGLGCVVALH